MSTNVNYLAAAASAATGTTRLSSSPPPPPWTVLGGLFCQSPAWGYPQSVRRCTKDEPLQCAAVSIEFINEFPNQCFQFCFASTGQRICIAPPPPSGLLHSLTKPFIGKELVFSLENGILFGIINTVHLLLFSGRCSTRGKENKTK